MVLLPAVLTALWVGVTRLRWGFNGSDPSFIISQARNLARGEIPHRDFLTPRLVGSPILHLPEVLLPLPTTITSRAVTLAEQVLIAVLGVRLVLDAPIRRWRVAAATLAAFALLVDLHTWFFDPWHTVDGLLLCTAAFVLLTRFCTRPQQQFHLALVAAALLGCAPLVKQSFAPALVIGLFALISVRQVLGTRRWGMLALCAAAPGLAMATWLAINGGLVDAIEQTMSARTPSVTAPFGALGANQGVLAPLAALLVAAAAAVATRPSATPQGIRAAAMTVVVGAVIWAPLAGALAIRDDWSTTLWWMLFAVIVVLRIRRRPIMPAAMVLSLGWMASLSWGNGLPTLYAGVIAAAVLISVLPREGLVCTDAPIDQQQRSAVSVPLPFDRRLTAGACAAVSIVAFLAIAVPFGSFRDEEDWRDTPKAAATADVSDISESLTGVLVNPGQASLLRGASECIHQHPARRIAIVPDSPGLNAALDLDNPFPSDWWWPPELSGRGDRVVATARRVAKDGDALVLFNTLESFQTATLRPLPDATSRTKPVDWDGTVARVIDALGVPLTPCGPYLAAHLPPKPAGD